ncbi:hypothetical protein FRC12_025035 [Ceratobasidium sp. 428]|nr:hypothetical protein FRC12_025035 [Ceratobasidium sp. 428]
MSSGHSPNPRSSTPIPKHAASTTHLPLTNDPGHYSPLARTRSGSKSTSCQDASIIEPACRRSSSCPNLRDPDIQVGTVSSQGDKFSSRTDFRDAQLARPTREQVVGGQSNLVVLALKIVGVTLNTIVLASQALSLLAVYPIKAYAVFVEVLARLRGRSQQQPTQPTPTRYRVRARGRGADSRSPGTENNHQDVARGSNCPDAPPGGPLQSLHGLPYVNSERDGPSERARRTSTQPAALSPVSGFAQGASYASPRQHHVAAPSPHAPVPDIFPPQPDIPVRGHRCDICGLVLRRPGLLDDHLNTHVGLRRE